MAVAILSLFGLTCPFLRVIMVIRTVAVLFVYGSVLPGEWRTVSSTHSVKHKGLTQSYGFCRWAVLVRVKERNEGGLLWLI